MKTLPLVQAEKSWDEFLNQAKLEAFKVEVLQDYYEHDKGPSLDAWLAGDHQKAIAIMLKDGPNQWHKDYQNRPINKIRLHVVETPYAPYIEWEIEIYKRIIIPYTGEHVSLVLREKTKRLDVPDGDFWIFDANQVVRYYYKNTKAYKADVYDANEGDDLSKFLKLKSELLKLAQPLD